MNQLVAQGKFNWNLHLCTKNLLRKEKGKREKNGKENENGKDNNNQEIHEEINDKKDGDSQDQEMAEGEELIKAPKGQEQV